MRPPIAAVCLAAALVALGPARVDGQAAERIAGVAGDGRAGLAGDGGPAIDARLRGPLDVAALDGGAFLIADTENHRIRRVDAAGRIATVAGAGSGAGYAGDGGPATAPGARLSLPQGVTPLPGGGFLIADTGNDVVRRVDARGAIATVAGTGEPGFGGDGGPAATALLDRPSAVAPLPGGGFLIADTGNQRVRRVAADGAIATVAGSGGEGFTGDGGPATFAAFSAPADVAALPGGGFLVADTGNGRIREVDAAGRITTFAQGLTEPSGVALAPDGTVLVADTGADRVVALEPGGALRPVAGTGDPGFSGDGGPPLAARLWGPAAVSSAGGRLLIADTFNERIRAVGTGAAVAPVPPPVAGRTAVVDVRAGVVRIRLPGRARFVRLAGARDVPLGSELDTRRGAVAVRFATTAAGREASAVASAGRFVLRQGRRRGGQRAGDLRLSAPLAGCPPVRAARGPVASAAARGGNRRKRRLRVRAEGRVQTTGRYGSAIVRGTRWTIADRCPRRGRAATTVRVAQGAVAVRDRVRRRTVVVRAGERYVARAAPRGG